ncbi:MAG TPA: hypothetical protein VF599_21930 [Pyrinomonadaceae bacterium]
MNTPNKTDFIPEIAPQDAIWSRPTLTSRTRTTRKTGCTKNA